MMTHRVDRLVPMVFVSRVDESISFYKLLGFDVADRLASDGRTNWAWLVAGEADLMLARADAPISADQQAILLYMYTPDVRGFREQLLRAGLRDGGVYRGTDDGVVPTRVVYAVWAPFYMPDGEVRVMDPDGHCVLVGQAEPLDG